MHIPFCIIKKQCVLYEKQKDQRGILTIIWGILGKTGIKTENKGDNRMNEMFELEGTALMIHLPAEVDHPVSDEIRKESDRILSKQYIRTMFFDFEKTAFMDSSGIGLLMGRYRALGMRQGCICAVKVNSRIDKLLHLSGVHRYIEIKKIQEEENR